MNNIEKKAEELARNLHSWYLEATKELKPESYNPNAQKPYDEMTDEQKFIDRYIAKKILDQHTQTEERIWERAVSAVKNSEVYVPTDSDIQLSGTKGACWLQGAVDQKNAAIKALLTSKENL